MIELLAITDDPTPPAPPLRAVHSGGLSALLAPAEAQEVTPEALWRHEARIEQLMAERDLLPVRFGTLLADERAAAQAIAERSDELTAGLERVRGAVELAVRAQGLDRPAAVEPETGSGRDYLRAKVGRAQAARLLHEPLSAIARETTVRHGADLLRAAYLVERGEVDAFVAAVRRLQHAHPELAILCTGPWPPYSFAEAS